MVFALLLIWGASYTALPVLMQTWVFKSSSHLNVPDAASSLYVVAYNGAIALGASFGGLIVDRMGARPVMIAAALVAVVALVIAARTAPN